MSEEKLYRIKLKLGTTEIEVEGDRDFVEKKFEELFNKVSRPIPQTKPSFEAGLRLEKVPFPEFIAEVSRNIGKEADDLTGPQKMIVIGYYFYKYEGRDFSYEDVKKATLEARLSGLANPRQYTPELIRRGYIQEVEPAAGEKKRFKILRRGIQYVESNFQVE